MASTPQLSLPAQAAAQAEWIVNSLVYTQYQYREVIDADGGIYECDCNSFMGVVLQDIAPEHYRLLPIEAGRPRPRAYEYCEFFSALASKPTTGWNRIDSLLDAQRGDIIAWQLSSKNQPGKDTGHVVFVAEAPTMLESGEVAIRVYDSAQYPHFEDTRGGEGQFPNGVGSGFINFQLHDHGLPPTIQFGPSDTPFTPFEFAIGRLEPFSA